MYDHVIWPERYHPETSAIYALNDIDVKAPSEVVWKLLVNAEGIQAAHRVGPHALRPAAEPRGSS